MRGSNIVLPPSMFSSPQARAALIDQLHAPPGPSWDTDIKGLREYFGRFNDQLAERMRQLYAVEVEHKILGGVRTQVITPKEGVAAANARRVLINLHGGAFLWGEGSGEQLESIPIASLGKLKVITVAYRQGPEHHFPAASEDVAAVYRALLKDYEPRSIGIYGCSAGGILTAQAVAWFDKIGLPQPGAIGTFCGSASPFGGDSLHLTAIMGEKLHEVRAPGWQLSWPYLAGVDPADPLVFPVNSPTLLAKFPPTLLLSSSRDLALSSLFHTQSQLARQGVQTELHVWDGLMHAFFVNPDLPESREAYDVIVRFFDRHLQRR